MKVAFVAPFYGREAAGGAESECRNTALRLAASGVDVSVLTTTLLDLQHDWNVGVHSPGVSNDEGVTVHRFPAEPLRRSTFAALNKRIVAGEVPRSDEEQRRFVAMHVNSFSLIRHLASHGGEYDWVCFIPYPYGTTCFGAQACHGNVVLIPCLHDEGYARLNPVRDTFLRAQKIVFHTPAERDLATQLYGDLGTRPLLLGEGVETEFESVAERFRSRYGLDGPFILYAGRKDRSKNVDELVRYFSAYKRANGGDLKLVMMGPGSIKTEDADELGIVDVGFIPDQDKKDAYSAATVFCLPSLNESFSIVTMEAWVCGTPTLVHGNCAVTRDHVVMSGGGLYYRSYPEFCATVAYLMKNSEMRDRMGAAGKRYVLDNFAWDTIISRYRKDLFEES